ncbi:hypothetical protein R1flu_024042 [Riccia fluitans]|uniref:Uncharacterized protein n=1 Tax=Riccia fluitans TaxID=41844 RepID=A0ABD1XTR3_9MARC
MPRNNKARAVDCPTTSGTADGRMQDVVWKLGEELRSVIESIPTCAGDRPLYLQFCLGAHLYVRPAAVYIIALWGLFAHDFTMRGDSRAIRF